MKSRKVVSILVLTCCVAARLALAQSPVSLTIGPASSGRAVPGDFSGFSFETGSLRYNHYRTNAYFFDSTNTQLLTFFRNLGIKSLRIGGNSVDRGYVPSTNDIDALFRFVRTAQVKVIYSLRLANGDPWQDAGIAKYLWDNYRPYLICLAIGNEPNSYAGLDPEITNTATFTAKWNWFAAAVTNAVPDVKLGGVDNGNGSVTWASEFAKAEDGNPNVDCILAHYEPGGPSRGKTSSQIIDEMLAPAIDDTRYPACYEKLAAMAQSHGWSLRFSEGNSHVATPASQGGNHSFATALFALDYLHWWAAHGCLSVHFHTGMGGWNGAMHPGTNGDYELYPIAYGIAAFNLGGHGTPNPVTINNPGHLNLTAYAVTDPHRNVFVTIINREHGENARTGMVTINAPGKSAEVIYLKAPGNDVTRESGITLGGVAVTDSNPWQGKWETIRTTGPTDCELKVEASSVAIVKLAALGALSRSE